jgi:hypothetical protein
MAGHLLIQIPIHHILDVGQLHSHQWCHLQIDQQKSAGALLLEQLLMTVEQSSGTFGPSNAFNASIFYDYE